MQIVNFNFYIGQSWNWPGWRFLVSILGIIQLRCNLCLVREGLESVVGGVQYCVQGWFCYSFILFTSWFFWSSSFSSLSIPKHLFSVLCWFSPVMPSYTLRIPKHTINKDIWIDKPNCRICTYSICVRLVFTNIKLEMDDRLVQKLFGNGNMSWNFIQQYYWHLSQWQIFPYKETITCTCKHSVFIDWSASATWVTLTRSKYSICSPHF